MQGFETGVEFCLSGREQYGLWPWIANWCVRIVQLARECLNFIALVRVWSKFSNNSKLFSSADYGLACSNYHVSRWFYHPVGVWKHVSSNILQMQSLRKKTPTYRRLDVLQIEVHACDNLFVLIGIEQFVRKINGHDVSGIGRCLCSFISSACSTHDAHRTIERATQLPTNSNRHRHLHCIWIQKRREKWEYPNSIHVSPLLFLLFFISYLWQPSNCISFCFSLPSCVGFPSLLIFEIFASILCCWIIFSGNFLLSRWFLFFFYFLFCSTWVGSDIAQRFSRIAVT